MAPNNVTSAATVLGEIIPFYRANFGIHSAQLIKYLDEVWDREEERHKYNLPTMLLIHRGTWSRIPIAKILDCHTPLEPSFFRLFGLTRLSLQSKLTMKSADLRRTLAELKSKTDDPEHLRYYQKAFNTLGNEDKAFEYLLTRCVTCTAMVIAQTIATHLQFNPPLDIALQAFRRPVGAIRAIAYIPDMSSQFALIACGALEELRSVTISAVFSDKGKLLQLRDALAAEGLSLVGARVDGESAFISFASVLGELRVQFGKALRADILDAFHELSMSSPSSLSPLSAADFSADLYALYVTKSPRLNVSDLKSVAVGAAEAELPMLFASTSLQTILHRKIQTALGESPRYFCILDKEGALLCEVEKDKTPADAFLDMMERRSAVRPSYALEPYSMCCCILY